MTVTRRIPLAIVVGALAAIVIAGCTSSSKPPKPTDGPTAPNGSSLSTPTTTATQPASSAPSTSPTPTSPADIAASQATAFVSTYLAEIDKLYADPTVSINDIYNVAVAPEATSEATAIAQFRGASDRQSGAQMLVKVSAVSVKLSGLGDTSANGKYPTVTLTACVDVSGVAATDSTGKSLVPPGRPRYLLDSLTIVNIKYPDSAGWRVSYATNKQAASCDA